MPTVQTHHPEIHPQCAGHAVTVFAADPISTSKPSQNSGKDKRGLRTVWTTVSSGKGWVLLELFGTCTTALLHA